MSERFVDITEDDAVGGETGESAGGAGRWWPGRGVTGVAGVTRPAGMSRVAGPPGVVLTALVVANAALTCWAFSVPGGRLVPVMVAVLVWLCLGLTYAARLGLDLVLAERPRRRAEPVRWLVVPALVIATAGLVLAAVPVRAGLALAEPTVLDFASSSSVEPPARAGFYRIAEADRLPGGGARFVVEGAGFVDRHGFAYSPSGLPARDGANVYTHLDGPWYLWAERF